MNRQRRPDESLKDYRKSMVIEQRALDQRLKGVKVYHATDIVDAPNPAFNQEIPMHHQPGINPTVKRVFSRGPARATYTTHGRQYVQNN